MVASIVSVVSSSGQTATSSNTIPSTDVQSGDIAVFGIAISSPSQTVTAPTGSTEITGSPVAVGTTLELAVFKKTMTGTEEDDVVTAALGGTVKWGMGTIILRGVTTENVIAIASDNTADTTAAYPDFTPHEPDSFAVAIVGIQVPVSSPAVAHSAPTGWTERTEAQTAVTDPQIGIAIATKQLTGQDEVAQGVANGAFTGGGARDAVVILAFTAGSPNTPPVANAGPNQTVQAYTQYTLNGSGSTDSDGTIASYLWTGEPGAPTLSSYTVSNPTATAVGKVTDEVYTYTLEVTDDDGAVSSPDTVDITVPAWDQFYRLGGQWVPMEPVRVRSAGDWEE